MAEVSIIAPLNIFERASARRSNYTNTFPREEPQREANKDWLLRGMQQAYDTYRKIQKGVKQKQTKQLVIVCKSIGSSSIEKLNDYVKKCELETCEINLEQYSLIQLQNWLIESLRCYEQKWLDPILPLKVVEALDEIGSLEANWDSQNAEPVSNLAIESAKKLLTHLGSEAINYEPFADPEGGLGLESHKEGKSIYIIATSDNTFTYVLRDGKTIHRGSNVSLETMRHVVSTLY